MKRGKPLQRSTPLTARTGLTSRTELARGSGPTRSAPLPRARQPAEPRPTSQRVARALQLATWAQVKQLAHERDGWACVGCGRTDRPLDAHHRVFKGQGGSKLLDVVENALTLCGPGNAYGCHGVAHDQKNGRAREYGWSLTGGTDPLAAAVRYRDGWYRLTADGDRYRVA